MIIEQTCKPQELHAIILKKSNIFFAINLMLETLVSSKAPNIFSVKQFY